MARPWEAREGSPDPLGVSRIEADGAFNFAIYSRHAIAVTLLLYANGDFIRPRTTIALDPHRNKSGRVWHCRLTDGELADAEYYGYQATGESGPFHRFDAEKLLLDPWAKGVFFPPNYDRGAASRRGSN